MGRWEREGARLPPWVKPSDPDPCTFGFIDACFYYVHSMLTSPDGMPNNTEAWEDIVDVLAKQVFIIIRWHTHT